MPNRHLSNHLLHVIGDEEEITSRILEERNTAQDFDEDENEGDIPIYDFLTGKTFANSFERDEWYAMHD